MADVGYLIAGLGNPGPEYRMTRHNVGFFLIDFLADKNGLQSPVVKMKGRYCRGRLHGCSVFFVKPQTYMNRSGECIRAFADYYKIPATHILVLHDDIDLAPGRIKIVAKGGTGGHNGIRSIAQHLGTTEFSRIKVGIGRPEFDDRGHGQPVERYVLSKFSDLELKLFNERADLVEEAVDLFIKQGVVECMNCINGR